MTLDQEKRVTEALVDFIERVTKGNAASETETAVLPEAVKALIEINSQI